MPGNNINSESILYLHKIIFLFIIALKIIRLLVNITIKNNFAGTKSAALNRHNLQIPTVVISEMMKRMAKNIYFWWNKIENIDFVVTVEWILKKMSLWAVLRRNNLVLKCYYIPRLEIYLFYSIVKDNDPNTSLYI